MKEERVWLVIALVAFIAAVSLRTVDGRRTKKEPNPDATP
jgi:hypothetical protein